MNFSRAIHRKPATRKNSFPRTALRPDLFVALPFVSSEDSIHAVSDTAEPAIARVSEHFRTVLYVPGISDPEQLPSSLRCAPLSLLASNVPKFHEFRRYLGRVPAAVRKDWPAAATDEALNYIHMLSPSIIHGEYLQTAELILATPDRATITLHDRSASIARRLFTTTRGPARAYRWAEYKRIERLEALTLRHASAVFALSHEDTAHFSEMNDDVTFLQFGIDPPSVVWSFPSDLPLRVGFFGAMWRHANIAIVKRLLTKIMPVIWARHPDLQFWIIGAEPPTDLRDLAACDPRVKITGYVADVNSILLQTHLMLIPSVLGGGVLLKLVRSMALGLPIVTNRLATAGLPQIDSCVVIHDTDEALAAAVLDLLADPVAAAELGRRARQYIQKHLTWDRTINTYREVFDKLLKESPSR